jgi:hypothetical protein
MVLTEFGADRVDLAEKNILRGVTFDTEKISKLSTILLDLISPKWLLPLPFRQRLREYRVVRPMGHDRQYKCVPPPAVAP